MNYFLFEEKFRGSTKEIKQRQSIFLEYYKNCQKNGLDVQKSEALSYLKSLEDKSLEGVFSGQLVEHLQPLELINLVN